MTMAMVLVARRIVARVVMVERNRKIRVGGLRDGYRIVQGVLWFGIGSTRSEWCGHEAGSRLSESSPGSAWRLANIW
jgi:hypothetical protein